MSEHEQSSPNWPIQRVGHVPPMWFFTGKDKEAEEANERNTHFAGFADNLWMELVQSPDWPFPGINMAHIEVTQALKTIIARRAYDFAFHVLAYMPASERAEYGDVPDCLEHVPDMTEWPEQE